MTQINYVVFDATGRILGSGHCADADLGLQPNGWPAGAAVLQVAAATDPNLNYVTGEPPTQGVAARPTFSGSLDKTAISANGTDAATLSGLPNPTTVTLTGPQGRNTYTVTDGSFALTTAWPGAYRIDIDPFPQLPASFTVNAS
jgi:hypothetical protein